MTDQVIELTTDTSGAKYAQSAVHGPCGVQHTFFVIDGIMIARMRFSDSKRDDCAMKMPRLRTAVL